MNMILMAMQEVKHLVLIVILYILFNKVFLLKLLRISNRCCKAYKRHADLCLRYFCTQRLQIWFSECCLFQVQIFYLMQSVYKDTRVQTLGPLKVNTSALVQTRATMIVVYFVFFWVFAACTAFRPPRRGTFAPVQDDSDTPHLIEGDIALPPSLHLSGSALNSFLKATTSLWPFGRVPYRIDTEQWGGVVEPVFLDDQIENITQALQKIETGVPCIDFR